MLSHNDQHQRSSIVRAFDYSILIPHVVSGLQFEMPCGTETMTVRIKIEPVNLQIIGVRCVICHADLWFQVVIYPKATEAVAVDIEGRRYNVGFQ